MRALITGASSGIGRDMARYLASKNIDLILVARRKERLEDLKKECNVSVEIVELDLLKKENLYKLFKKYQNKKIDILINNAGFGLYGDYNEADLLTELNMIELNVKAVHILTRMFLKDMTKKNKGYILNVSSSAGLLKGGPLMSTYYATKAYVTSFTLAISEELRRNKSKVKVSVLCPGPVKTNFNKRAGVKFNIGSLSARNVARYAIDKIIHSNKLVIVPGFKIRMGVFFSRFVSIKKLLKITYNIQKRKDK